MLQVIGAARVYKWNTAVKIPQNSPIIHQIHSTIKNKPSFDFTIDCSALAVELSKLIPRMSKAVLEIILEYYHHNPEQVQIMMRKDAPPYGGQYDPATQTTSMDLLKFPDPLVVILSEFIRLVKSHTPQ